MYYVELPYVSQKVAEDFQKSRNILIHGNINKDIALRFMMVIKEMEADSQTEPIWVVIDSAGGAVQAGWTIIDSMHLCKAPVYTVCYGEASSISAVIFASGEKGHRLMLKHSRLMVHQPWADLGGWPIKENALNEASKDLTETRYEIENALSEASGLPISKIREMCDGEFRMTAQEAVRLGFADSIIERDVQPDYSTNSI